MFIASYNLLQRVLYDIFIVFRRHMILKIIYEITKGHISQHHLNFSLIFRKNYKLSNSYEIHRKNK